MEKFDVDEIKRRCSIEVYPKKNEDPGHLIKRFMRRVRDSGIVLEYKMKSRYEKPSERKRRKMARSLSLSRSEEFREK